MLEHEQEKGLESPDPTVQCLGFNELKEWQVGRYREAVDEARWYMNENLNRSVDWHEAEQDFSRNDFYGCAQLWRNEFCNTICDHRTQCKIRHTLCS